MLSFGVIVPRDWFWMIGSFWTLVILSFLSSYRYLHRVIKNNRSGHRVSKKLLNVAVVKDRRCLSVKEQNWGLCLLCFTHSIYDIVTG